MRKALVVGLGPLGRRVVRELRSADVETIAASRTRPDDFDGWWTALDATDSDAVRAAAEGCDTVLLCAAPPLTHWASAFPALIDGVLDGLAGADATLVLASNMWPYGPPAGPLDETAPERPAGPRGRLRRDLDQRVLAADETRGLRTAVVRASSFYGPEVVTSVAGRAQLRALAQGRRIDVLGSADQPQTFTYIDDFARAMVRVAGEPTAQGQIWLAPVQRPMTLRQLLEQFGAPLGATPTLRVATSMITALIGVVNPEMRALKETLYVYTSPFIVDDTRFRSTFGEAATPLEQTIVATLADIGFGVDVTS